MEISRETRLELYRNLVMFRKIYHAAYAFYLQSGSKGNFVMGDGEEAISVAIGANLRRNDSFKPNFRQMLGLFVKKGYTLEECLGYRIFDPEKGFLGYSLSLGEDVGVYTGVALSAQIRGTDQVTVCAFGEGTASRGPIHEAMVTAAAWKLPIVYVIQNNKFCGATHWQKVYRFDDLSERAKAYGMPGETVDGNDMLAIYEVMKKFIDRARSGGGPALVVADTYRLSPYFERAPGEIVLETYRTTHEIEENRKNDPIPRYQKVLIEQGVLTEADIPKIDAELDREIQEAGGRVGALPRMTAEQYFQYAIDRL